MASIFISYRRESGSGFAGRLEADLERRFGGVQVFRDVDDLVSGEDFVVGLERALERCRVLLVVIDGAWLAATDGSGARRLDDPRDFVRREISGALRRGVLVVPVLVGGAGMPAEAELPDELKPLARRQAHELADARWDYDMGRLADTIASVLGRTGKRTSTAARRRNVLVAGLAALTAAIGAGWYLASRTPDLGGTWDLPNGSYWIVEQTGRELTIQEVHYDSREVWKKGRGSIEGDAVQFKLDLVFERGYTTEGTLRVSARGRRMTGVALTRPKNTQDDMVLSKR